LRKGCAKPEPANPQYQIAQHGNTSGIEPSTGPGKKTARARAFIMVLFNCRRLLALFESNRSLTSGYIISFKVALSSVIKHDVQFKLTAHLRLVVPFPIPTRPPCKGVPLSIRNSALIGPYRRNIPRALCWSQEGVLFLTSEVPLYAHPRRLGFNRI
jgi:hypothetical protein